MPLLSPILNFDIHLHTRKLCSMPHRIIQQICSVLVGNIIICRGTPSSLLSSCEILVKSCPRACLIVDTGRAGSSELVRLCHLQIIATSHSNRQYKPCRPPFNPVTACLVTKVRPIANDLLAINNYNQRFFFILIRPTLSLNPFNTSCSKLLLFKGFSAILV